jgi:hypothetical protein
MEEYIMSVNEEVIFAKFLESVYKRIAREKAIEESQKQNPA